MKKALAILGALLVVALGFMMPHIAAAYQDRSLEGDVWRMENAPVSLALVEEMVEIPELNLLQSLELFSFWSEGVPLEDGQKTSKEEALRIASEVVEYLRGLPMINGYPDEAIPLLVTNANGRSGIFWRCGWVGHEDEAIWIDDAHSNLAGFVLRGDGDPITEDIIGIMICEHFFPSYVDASLIRSGDGGEYWIRLSQDGEVIFLTVEIPESAIPLQDGYLCFNAPHWDRSPTVEPSGEVSPEG